MCVVYSSHSALSLSIATNVLTKPKEVKSNQGIHFVGRILKKQIKSNQTNILKIVVPDTWKPGSVFKILHVDTLGSHSL